MHKVAPEDKKSANNKNYFESSCRDQIHGES